MSTAAATTFVELSELFAQNLAADAMKRAGNRADALILCQAAAGMFDELAVAETTSENIRATHVEDAAAWRRAHEIITAAPMTFHEAAMIAAFSDRPVHELLEIPADIAENIDAANWKAGTGLTDDSERRVIFRQKRTAAALAVSAKSGGGTSVDDVADLISSHCPDISDADYEQLHAAVMEAIPTARFSQTEADAWNKADAYCRAEAAAERRMCFG
jgi:hypothetical protein